MVRVRFFLTHLIYMEEDCLRYQFGTLKQCENIKYLSYAFTEQGVTMFS